MTSIPVELDRAVRAFLERTQPGATLRSLRALPGGHSGHTLLASFEDGGPGDLVVKAGAPGRPPVGRHDVLRQQRVLRALAGHPGVLVPAVAAAEEGDPPMFAMTFAAGDSIEPVLEGVAEMKPETVERRARQAVRMLGALHQVDVDDTPLSSEPVSRIEDELDRWAKTIAAVDPTLVVGADDLLERLRGSVPAAMGRSVVHGDYRLGNLLCAGDSPTAIIDWEIWSVSDPRIDLGWMFLFCDQAEFPEVGHPAPGMPSAAELHAEYESVMGPTPDVAWFLAFARMKMAAIMGHNLKRHREGRYHDPYQERLPPTIASLVRRGLEHWSEL